MRDAVATTTTNLSSYRRDRPRLLLLVREETRSDYQANGRSPRPSSPLPEDEPETVADWSRVHARIVELSAERALRERELCRSPRCRAAGCARAGYAVRVRGPSLA